MQIDTQSLLADAGIAQQPTPAKKKELGADEFLKLMTEQLKNQDPLKPLESSAFLGQLAQFSSVQGIQQLNGSFASLAASVDTDKTLQGAALIGRDVMISADSFANQGAGIAGELTVPLAGSVTVEIADASGAVVRRMTAQSTAPGALPFAWNGKRDDGTPAAAGDYKVTARVNSGQRTEALQTSLVARVDSVSLTPSGPVLNLASLGATPLSAVRRIN